MTQWQPGNQPRHRAGQPPATPPQWQQQGAPPPQEQPRWVPLEQREPYGQQQGPPQYQPPQQYAPRPRKKHTGLKVAGGIGGGLVALIVIAAVASSGKPAAPSPAAQGQAAAQPSHSAAAAKAVTVATYSGSGITNTPAFTVGPTWKVSYSFDCSNFGQSGNFILMEDGTFGALNVNVLAFTKSGTSYAYNDAGKHYLEVNSECAWKVKITDEGS